MHDLLDYSQGSLVKHGKDDSDTEDDNQHQMKFHIRTVKIHIPFEESLRRPEVPMLRLRVMVQKKMHLIVQVKVLVSKQEHLLPLKIFKSAVF